MTRIKTKADPKRARELVKWCYENMSLVCDEEILVADQLDALADEVERLRRMEQATFRAANDTPCEFSSPSREDVVGWLNQILAPIRDEDPQGWTAPGRSSYANLAQGYIVLLDKLEAILAGDHP